MFDTSDIGLLPAWLDQATTSSLPPLAGIATVIGDDLPAVQQAIISPYSSGVNEGRITDVELQKTTHGRPSKRPAPPPTRHPHRTRPPPTHDSTLKDLQLQRSCQSHSPAYADNDLPILADLGYEGEAQILVLPIKKPVDAALTDDQRQLNRLQAYAPALAEQANALLKTTFKALRRLSLPPDVIGTIIAATLVQLHIEHDRTTWSHSIANRHWERLHVLLHIAIEVHQRFRDRLPSSSLRTNFRSSAFGCRSSRAISVRASLVALRVHFTQTANDLHTVADEFRQSVRAEMNMASNASATIPSG